jgi:ethanolamine transporter EutH
MALLAAPVTGGLFTLATLRYAERVRVPLPQWFSVGVVAGGVAALVGAGLWALAATLDPTLDRAVITAINDTMGQLPEAFAGGMLGGGLGGVALELLSLRQRERAASRTLPPAQPAPALTPSA